MYKSNVNVLCCLEDFSMRNILISQVWFILRSQMFLKHQTDNVAALVIFFLFRIFPFPDRFPFPFPFPFFPTLGFLLFSLFLSLINCRFSCLWVFRAKPFLGNFLQTWTLGWSLSIHASYILLVSWGSPAFPMSAYLVRGILQNSSWLEASLQEEYLDIFLISVKKLQTYKKCLVW